MVPRARSARPVGDPPPTALLSRFGLLRRPPFPVFQRKEQDADASRFRGCPVAATGAPHRPAPSAAAQAPHWVRGSSPPYRGSRPAGCGIMALARVDQLRRKRYGYCTPLAPSVALRSSPAPGSAPRAEPRFLRPARLRCLLNRLFPTPRRRRTYHRLSKYRHAPGGGPASAGSWWACCSSGSAL